MLPKSLLNAKSVLFLSLAITLSSAYFGQRANVKAAQLKNQAASAETEAAKAALVVDELRAVLTKDSTPQPLERAIGRALTTIYNARTTHGVSVSQLSPGKLSGMAATPLLDLAEEVPGTPLQSVKVNLTGSYQTYSGLLEYLDTVQQGPVALSRLLVQGNTFEASLRVFGTLE